MSLSVVWSPNAEEDLAEVLLYVEDTFGVDVALRLLDTIEEKVELIAEFPRMYPRSVQRPEIRKAVITRQTSLIYRIWKEEVQILHVWDNRRLSGEI